MYIARIRPIGGGNSTSSPPLIGGTGPRAPVGEHPRIQSELVEHGVQGVGHRQRTSGTAVAAADAHVDRLDRLQTARQAAGHGVA